MTTVIKVCGREIKGEMAFPNIHNPILPASTLTFQLALPYSFSPSPHPIQVLSFPYILAVTSTPIVLLVLIKSGVAAVSGQGYAPYIFLDDC